MRFGIITMQRESLVPVGVSTEEALTYIATLDHADLVRQLSSHGFNPIELSGDMALFLPQSFSPPTIERLVRLKRGSGVGYTVHLPLWSVEPSTPLSSVRQGSVRAVIDTILRTLCLEPEVYVLHATGALAAEFYQMELPDLAKGLILRQFQRNASESLRTILTETGIRSRTLAIETIEFPFDLTLELAERLDLSICLDTGHVLAGFSGPIGLAEALDRCLPRLAEIHRDPPARRAVAGSRPQYRLRPGSQTSRHRRSGCEGPLGQAGGGQVRGPDHPRAHGAGSAGLAGGDTLHSPRGSGSSSSAIASARVVS